MVRLAGELPREDQRKRNSSVSVSVCGGRPNQTGSVCLHDQYYLHTYSVEAPVKVAAPVVACL